MGQRAGAQRAALNVKFVFIETPAGIAGLKAKLAQIRAEHGITTKIAWAETPLRHRERV